VHEEIMAFKRLHGERGVFAFIVSGEPKVEGAADDCFSPALRAEIGADDELSTTPAEVVAADARAEGDGPKLAFLRLVAGLLGVGFDELRQRELQRRNRRLTLITTGSLAGMALTFGLALVAWQARNDARRRQDQAEDVLAFMLGDFRSELQKAGRLPLLKKVGDEAMKYFDSLDARDLTDTALARQAKALTQIGEVRLEQKDVPPAEAARAFAAAYQRAAALASRHPKNGPMLFERAQAEYWIGFVHRQRGNLPAAGEWLTRYRDSALALAQVDPTNLAWQRELVAGHHNLAVLDLDRGDLPAADAGFRAELAMNERMLIPLPADAQLQFRVADTHSWLGRTAERAGRLADAGERYGQQIRLLEALSQAEPRTARWRVRLADAYELQAGIFAITGRRAESMERRQQARVLLEALVAQDSTNRAWFTSLLIVRAKEAMLLQVQGDLVSAARLIAEARTSGETLAKAEPADRSVAQMLATAWRVEAELRMLTGRADAAEAATRALSIGASLIVPPGANEGFLGEYFKAAVVAGMIADRDGDRPAALRHWQDVADAAERRRDSSNSWRVLDPTARALALLGRVEAGRAIVERLTGFGYQPLTPWPEVFGR
jgi:eukaryotic-like serine/threonine-protein kinase